MALTPEGKTKLLVKKLLQRHNVYWFMPVQNGLGSVGLDFHCCVKGKAFFIETKAGNKQPTPRQENTMNLMRMAGGKCFVVNDETGYDLLETWLDEVDDARF
jgi:hypothetical protein